MRILDIDELDRYLKFLQDQATRLRRSYPKERWAQSNADNFMAIHEILRELRQQQQMRGVGGRIG